MINLVVFVISLIVLVFIVWFHSMQSVVSVRLVLVRFLFVALSHSVWVLVTRLGFVVKLA
jgi:hypothetical protein